MKRIFWIALLLLLTFLSLSSEVNAQERRGFYSGARCLAMGGACIAVVNDETALLVNPAALGKLRNFYGTLIDPEFEGNYQLPGFYQDKAISNPFLLEDVLPSINNRRSAYYHAKAQVFPSFVARNFGIGLYGNYLLDAEMSGDGTTVNTYYRSDLALALGFNFRFFDGRLKLGFNAKVINRIELDDPVLSTTGPLDYESLASEGVGLSTDMGIILSAPWALIPTVSAVVRDIGGTSFDQLTGVRMSSTTRPNAIRQDIDIGAALFPIHTNSTRSSWTIEYRGLLTSQDETDKAKLLHAGMEFNFGDVLFLRAGYNQRYWTAGAELASERFQWQISSYGEEVGTINELKEDRRYVFKFSYRY